MTVSIFTSTLELNLHYRFAPPLQMSYNNLFSKFLDIESSHALMQSAVIEKVF